MPNISDTVLKHLKFTFLFVITFFSCTQDREYLQEEQIFLDNLKKKSYRLSFNTDWPTRAGCSQKDSCYISCAEYLNFIQLLTLLNMFYIKHGFYFAYKTNLWCLYCDGRLLDQCQASVVHFSVDFIWKLKKGDSSRYDNVIQTAIVN